MLKIVISQRMELVKDINECRDCLDVNWAKMLAHFSAQLFPIPNYTASLDQWVRALEPDCCILSGGNDILLNHDQYAFSKKRDDIEKNLLHICESKHIPVLGVCRGFQMINLYCGGQISTINNHVGNDHCITPASRIDGPLGKQRKVNSFHNWGIKQGDLGTDLLPISIDESCNIEAARHANLPWLGVMWHPERAANTQKWDLQLIDWFFKDFVD